VSAEAGRPGEIRAEIWPAMVEGGMVLKAAAWLRCSVSDQGALWCMEVVVVGWRWGCTAADWAACRLCTAAVAPRVAFHDALETLVS
jgi:hypothetical protein